jgi:steroid delta-isomerase-like uncharacterized protein
MRAEEIRAFLDDRIERVWNGNDWSLADRSYAEDVVVHLRHQGEPIRGLDAFRDFHTSLHSSFPDWHATIHDVIIEGHLIAARWTVGGTHLGSFMGFPPTGRTYEVNEAFFARMGDDGLAHEFWFFVDELGIARQLGLMPDGPPPKAFILAMKLRPRFQRAS